jgi:hypothetical protein
MKKRETNHQHAPIMMTESYWMNTQLSVARYTGGINAFGQSYIIVDKRGHDIFECSKEAQLVGRDKAIEPGEPADLVDVRYVKIYRKAGREKFIQMVKSGLDLNAMKEELKAEKSKKAEQKKLDL